MFRLAGRTPAQLRSTQNAPMAAKAAWVKLTEQYRLRPDAETLQKIVEAGPRGKTLAGEIRQRNHEVAQAMGLVALGCLPEIVFVFQEALNVVLSEIEQVEVHEREVWTKYGVPFEASRVLKALCREAENLANEHMLFNRFLANPPSEVMLQSPRQILRGLFPE
jgi:hypothetical protein